MLVFLLLKLKSQVPWLIYFPPRIQQNIDRVHNESVKSILKVAHFTSLIVITSHPSPTPLLLFKMPLLQQNVFHCSRWRKYYCCALASAVSCEPEFNSILFWNPSWFLESFMLLISVMRTFVVMFPTRPYLESSSEELEVLQLRSPS